MYVSRTSVDNVDISVALHNTESWISAMGASNRNADRCNSEASSEWIRLGAVAFLWWSKSTLSDSPTATRKLQVPSSCNSMRCISGFISRCVTTKPDGVVHVNSVE